LGLAVTDILTEQDKVTGVRLKNLKTGVESTLGLRRRVRGHQHLPNTQLFKGQITSTKIGYTSRQLRARPRMCPACLWRAIVRTTFIGGRHAAAGCAGGD
jgi:hypothetical protein